MSLPHQSSIVHEEIDTPIAWLGDHLWGQRKVGGSQWEREGRERGERGHPGEERKLKQEVARGKHSRNFTTLIPSVSMLTYHVTLQTHNVISTLEKGEHAGDNGSHSRRKQE